MNPFRDARFLLVPLAAVVCGCSVERAPLDQAELRQALDGGPLACPSDAGTCVDVAEPIDPSEGCSQSRWVAKLAAPGPCPAVAASGGTWNEAPLFQASAAGLPVPPGLRGFCLYEWSSSAGLPPDVNALTAIDEQLEARDPDCHVVAGLGGSVAVDAGWTSLRDAFRESSGYVATLPSAAVGPHPIRVAVVDAAPRGYSGGAPADDLSGHGQAVGEFIRELGCPGTQGSACVANISNHLALPLITPELAAPSTGGYFGYQSQSARAIHSAVSDWRVYNASASAAQPRLVVNLSIAWDSVYGGAFSSPSDLKVPARAVLAAIKHARCRGAAVIAAAGNDPGGPARPKGPMYPAGWETQAAPGAIECQALEGNGYGAGAPYPLLPAPGAAYDPLVFAAAGVRWDDDPLANARVAGRSRIAAIGSHCVAEIATATGVEPSTILTGSSCAAAVTSAAVATAWAYRPSLTAPELVETIWSAGVDLGVDADFCVGGEPCPMAAGSADRRVRRISVCEGLNAACSGGLERCPAPASLPVCNTAAANAGLGPLIPASVMTDVAADVSQTLDAGALINELPGLAVCGTSAVRSSGSSYSDNVCGYRRYPGTPLRPWMGPQPGCNPCPLCVLEVAGGQGTLYLSISPEFPGSLGRPVMIINRDPEGRGGTEYPLELEPLAGGDEVVVSNLDLGGKPVENAVVWFTESDTSEEWSTESELIVKE